MKRNIIVYICLLALSSTSAEDWIGDRFHMLFRSLNIRSNGLEVTFNPNFPYSIYEDELLIGGTPDHPTYLIRHGTQVSFSDMGRRLKIIPLDDLEGENRFRVVESVSSIGKAYRREGTLRVDLPDGAGEGEFEIINEVIYEIDPAWGAFKVVATRNLEPNVSYEDHVDTNALRLLQYQDYRNTHRCTNNSSVPKLKYSEWLQEREVLDRNVGASNSASVGKKTELGRGYVWIILFGGVTLLLLGFGVFFVKKRQM